MYRINAIESKWIVLPYIVAVGDVLVAYSWGYSYISEFKEVTPTSCYFIVTDLNGNDIQFDFDNKDKAIWERYSLLRAMGVV